MSDHLSASLRIGRSAAEIFDFLRRPEHHSDFDASDTVGATLTPGPLHRVGDVFTMEMSWRGDDGHVTRYRTDNHVTQYQFNRLLAWEVAPAGERPLGWGWRFELTPHSDWETAVRLTYDWEKASAQTRELYGLPAFGRVELEAALALLDLALVAAHGDRPRVEDD